MFRVLTKLAFLIGVSIGVFLAILVKIHSKNVVKKETAPVQRPFHYDKWPKNGGLHRRQVSFDSIRYSNETYNLESSFLYKKVSVFCLILVKTPQNANAAEDTWAKRCNKVHLLNITSEKKKMPLLKRNREDSSWVLLCKALRIVPEDYNWVLIVYDYTFVLLENLRLFLASLNHNDTYYLGHAVQFWSTIYNMGQAGYVLSKGSLDRLKQKLNSTDSCTKSLTYRNQEDYYLGKNLASINITPVDTRDGDDLSTFHPYNLNHVFFPGENYYKFSIYPHKCCSPYSVAFQAIDGSKMYTYYYLLYTLQLFHDGHLGNKPTSKALRDDEVWRNFLKSRNISGDVSAEQYYKIWSDIVHDPATFNRKMMEEEYIDIL